MTNEIDKVIRKLVHINDIVSEKQFHDMIFVPYVTILNNFRAHADQTNLDELMQIPMLADLFRDGTVWRFDDTSPENFFYIDLIAACPMLANYGWYHDQPVSFHSVTTGIRAMIKRLSETKDGFSFIAELTRMAELTTADACKVAYLVGCFLTKNVSESSRCSTKVCELKKTRSGKVY